MKCPFRAGLGPAGLWWGLVAGLATVAVLLSIIVRRRMARDLSRIAIDREDVAVDAG